jgi:DNA-binding MarR family transcriptional regulator
LVVYHRVVSEPRWLDEREARAWRGYRKMRDLLDLQISRDLARDTGLSDADYTVLVVLSEAPRRRMRMLELGERILWSNSRLSHQLSRMEQRDLIRREAHARNSRAIDAVLTPRGLRIIKRAAVAHLDSVRRHFIDHLTDDQIDALGDATDKVIQHLRSLPEQPQGGP